MARNIVIAIALVLGAFGELGIALVPGTAGEVGTVCTDLVLPKKYPAPHSLYKKIVRLGNIRPRIEGKILAQFWVEYEFNKKPTYPLYPPIKSHQYIHVELNRVFRDRVARTSQIQFLSYLRRHDFELHEFALGRMKAARQELEERSEAFVPQAVVEEWSACKLEQDLAEGLFPDATCDRNLLLVLRQISRGEMGEAKTIAFLNALNETDTELYQSFADFVLDALEPGDPNVPDYERWAKEWNALYQAKESGIFFPTAEENSVLLKSLQYYLGECDEPTQRRFFASLKRRNRVLFSYAMELDEFVRTSTAKERSDHSLLSIPRAVRDWDLFFRTKISRRSLLPDSQTQPRLYEMLKRLLSGVTLPAHYQGFLQVLQENNQVLYWYLRFEKKRTEQLQNIGYGLRELHEERWAFEWIDYVRHKKEDEPIFPTRSGNRHLHGALMRLRLNKASEGEWTSFLSALNSFDQPLYEYAVTYLDSATPLGSRRNPINRGDYQRWGGEWVAYNKGKAPSDPTFPRKRDYPYLYRALRIYRVGEAAKEDWDRLMQYLKKQDRKLFEYAEANFEEPVAE